MIFETSHAVFNDDAGHGEKSTQVEDGSTCYHNAKKAKLWACALLLFSWMYKLCCESFPSSDHRRRKAAVPDLCMQRTAGQIMSKKSFGAVSTGASRHGMPPSKTDMPSSHVNEHSGVSAKERLDDARTANKFVHSG